MKTFAKGKRLRETVGRQEDTGGDMGRPRETWGERERLREIRGD